ncbi:hypothetical protein ALC57_19055, partial [Trachymyrmex cornetzi]
RNGPKTQKDPLLTNCNKNVIYKIDCNDCDASYVGQTCRQLGTRISEHRNDIKKKNTNQTVVTMHRNNHDFKWQNVKISDIERNYNKRLISKIINIKRQTNGINLNKDTELLCTSYFCFLTDG